MKNTFGKRAIRAAGGIGAVMAVTFSGLVAGTSTSYAAPVTQWKTSFEDSEPQVDGEQYTQPENFTGDRFVPGSLLRRIVEIDASGDNPPNETKEMLADGDKNTKWLVFSGANQWVSYTFDQPVQVSSYSLTSGNDASERDPKHFRIEASTDGVDWQVIEEHSDAAWAGRGVTNEYELEELSAPYQYWRFNVIASSGASLIQVADWELFTPSDGTIGVSDLALEPATGPTSALNAKTGVGFTGMKSAKYSGRHIDEGPAKSEVFIQQNVDVEIDANSELSYKVFPVLDGTLDGASTYVGVDLEFDDGSRLSETGLQDIYGYQASAKSWGASNLLVPAEWNSIKVDLSSLEGKTVRHVIFSYDNPAGTSESSTKDGSTMWQSHRRSGLTGTALMGWFLLLIHAAELTHQEAIPAD